ncbi:WD repeat and FYVE domain-containing protein 3-like isoform X3 [Lineus longissimus]|uniref:WD repeat and FYVE domain-containing protein 3-like isoform X3 n=1 Tax=Lineus longissimus TaxID=88925 RepID=UPI00315DB60A
MNIMRKVMGGHTRPVTESAAQSHDNVLGLMHLRKLFNEFRHPPGGTTQKEQEEKLYAMLPLFIKVFGSSHSSDMTEKFSDILQFCSHVSKLMVSEIRRRASNQSTDMASCAIVKFLEIESTEEASNGWMLLSVINLLSTGSPSLIDCMTAASLPSTLVKCLYLFFDLPDVIDSNQTPECAFTPRERRILLQKVFVQVQIRLCSHASPAEELALKDDLTLLFSAITSWCPPHNVPWRKSSAEVLMTLSRHGLTPSVVQYIHEKGCVALCIYNMQRVQELSPLEIVEMFVTVFCFLKDSSEVSQVLLDDFRACHGYIFLSEFLLRLEQDEAEEAKQALRNLVLIVGSLTTCGFIELKPGTASTGSLFQMPGFTLPQPSGKGVSVRNIQAFQVLQSVFLKSNTTHLCSTILDVINSIYHQDNANYFILEPQHTLSQFTEKIHIKPPEIQQKFFEILEFLVFSLNFVPCKELISLSILVKTQTSVETNIYCMKTLLRILRHHSIFKDVFREVGLLEVMVTCLHRYAALLKDVSSDEEDVEPISAENQEMGFLAMDGLSLTLNGNSSNAVVFRECGGARCVHNMVPYLVCRQQALSIIQQLILSNGGDDDMGTLLGLMHTAPTEALELKTHVLKALLNCLRESHRTRTVFRKVGGFVYVMSVLVSMEGCLADPPKSPWEGISRKDILMLLKSVFSTLTIAMRYEPANARFFTTEVRYGSLTEAVRLLGCFTTCSKIKNCSDNWTLMDEPPFDEFFCLMKESRLPQDIPKTLVSACRMMRYLYDMALDAFDRPPALSQKPAGVKRVVSGMDVSQNSLSASSNSNAGKRNSTGSLTLTLSAMQPDPIIVHSGAVTSILHLLPAIQCPTAKQLELELQVQTAEVLKSLMKKERNQQVMCEAGLPHELLTYCEVSLYNEAHPLHPPLQYVFERLAAQSLTPKDLVDFLRLGSPLSCNDLDERFDAIRNDTEDIENNNDRRNFKLYGGQVPLTRVKCLVSMTTPRDVRLHGTTLTPAFVEFDMNAEGFGCLYLPSIAPQGPPTPSVVGVGMVGNLDTSIVGGIGTGERVFPPQYGFSFSTWICVDKFSEPADAHPVRLLTIVRTIQGRDENLVCLSVYLSPRDRALIASTQETMMLTQAAEQFQDPNLSENTVRFWCHELTQEGQWHHLGLIFHRAGIMKNSSISVYIDGEHIATQKLHYISPNIGGGGNPSAAAVTSVFTFIGTPPQIRKQSKLIWRQGPCHLVEEILSASNLKNIYGLGPNYIGCFQAPVFDNSDTVSPLVSEDRVIFSIHAHTMSLMTIAKIRKVYNKIDSKSIAKQLSMSAHENATPIRILHNAAAHLSGPARSLGAILMGYLGVRTFCPKPVAKMLENVGGTSALLGLIAMAGDVEGLYAAVKALVCVVRNNKSAMREMIRTRGYQTLAMLFKKKRHLMNSHILHLTFSLVGTVDSGRESTVIPNRIAFEDLLCDLEVWHEAPGDLQRSLYEHFFELLTESSELQSNLKLMREVGLVNKLLHILKDSTLSAITIQTIVSVLQVLLTSCPDQKSILRFGQFLVSTLPTFSVSEVNISIDETESREPEKASTDQQPDDITIPVPTSYSGLVSPQAIRLRNTCLNMVLRLVTNSSTNLGNQQVCEELLRVLGYDWLLLFMQGHLHSSSVVLATRILLVMLSVPSGLAKFRDGSCGGGWLCDTESILQSRMGVLLAGFNIGSQIPRGQKREVNQEVCHIPGFTALQWLLPKHAHVPELYFLLMALLLGQQVKEMPEKVQDALIKQVNGGFRSANFSTTCSKLGQKEIPFDLDSVWTYIFGVPASQPMTGNRKEAKPDICPEATLVILAMIRSMLNQAWQTEEHGSWLREYPVTLMQFLLFLYHNQSDFVPLCMSSEFLCGLAATLFPYRINSENNSELSSPIDEFKPFPGSDETMVLVKSADRGGQTGYLTQHPARKFVMDFLRMIVVDSLSLSMTKQPPVIDILLEASPDHATRAQQKEFKTEIMKSLMDHLLAADALMGEQAALPVATGGSYANMATNIFYFSARVVDKLWQGAYIRDANEVFYFISKLISQAKRKSSGLSLDAIYKCLNRTILYQLSRPTYNVAEQMNIMDSLHKLTSNRSLVFGPGNYDQEFIGCLCYCLLQLTDDPSNLSTVNTIESPSALRTTTWHIDPDADEIEITKSGESTGTQEGLQLIANAATRVWEELYVCKKPALEEIFKVTLSTNSDTPKISTPELNLVRPLIFESAARMWVAFVESERKSTFTEREIIKSQIQSVSGKLQKVGSGVLRLATRKPKKDLPIRASPASVQDSNMWTFTHVSIVKDLVQFQFQQYQQGHQYMQKYLLEEWEQTETDLLRERGLWGPPHGSRLDKWQLDMTEGPFRMRKKMMRNSLFYRHYPFRPETDSNKPTKYKVAISLHSKEYYARCRARSLVGEEISDTIPEGDQMEELEEVEPGSSGLESVVYKRVNSNKSGNEDDEVFETDTNPDNNPDNKDPEDRGSEERTENRTDNQTVMRLLEDGEKISHMYRCARIQGLDTCEGLLLFGREHFYIIDGFTLLQTKEITDIDNLPPELHDPIIPRTANSGKTEKRLCSKFAYEDIREVHKRRYLLQPIAIEVFSADGRNYLLAFPRKVRNKIHARFMCVATAITDNAQQSVSGQRQNAKVEPGAGLISSLIGEKSVTQRWERGEISNFQYLMHLNTLAGRSYNDLMQYPVFPWILADYSSEELDLYNAATFRDLSKPMGAQTPDRLKQFQKRYHDWDDPQGETPPYHYGTHYSSAMIVASYLVRMEPFTQHFLRLQGGHFDLADRMFHSIKEGWLSASKHNMADVKELIPEFFYLPQFLVNSNNFDFGAKQSGVLLDNVLLPLWAKDDPREFIRAHREALECDYVSAHLHEWIDLIFGYKQQGPPAVEATNVFHHLFYEGNVDIYNIDDPLKKNATIGFINNFGQIPKALFKKPHPQKRLNVRNLDAPTMGPLIQGFADKLFFHNLDNLKPTMQPIKELKGAVGQIVHNDRTILAVEQNKVLIPPLYNRYLAWGFADLSIRIGNYDSDKANLVFENVDNGDILCTACPSARLLITGGSSTVVNVWEIGHGKDKRQLILKQPLYGHTEPVTCLAASVAFNMIVSGSRDRTCIIWDMCRLIFVRQLHGHAAPVAAVSINELTGVIATCAGTYLYVWSINGEEIANVNTATARNQQILCVAMSQISEWDVRNVIMTGSSDGVVRMWSVEFVQVPEEEGEKPKEKEEKLVDIPDASPVKINATTGPLSIEVALLKAQMKEFNKDEYLAAQKVELGSSAESEGTLDRRYEEISNAENLQKITADADILTRRRSLISDGPLLGQKRTDLGDLLTFDENPSLNVNKSASSVSVDTAIDALIEFEDTDVFDPNCKNLNSTNSDRMSTASGDLKIIVPDLETSSTGPVTPSSEFEIVSEKEVKEAEKTMEQQIQKFNPTRHTMNHLRDGFKWQRQLIFRSKLTMHTAFERTDNKEPAAVTTIAVSRDHKTVYVGDAKGRVYSWSVTDQPGRVVADHWVKDEGGDSCLACGVKFTFSERRHHCRNCGQLFCSRCSRFETEIRRLRILKPVRVCQSCFNSLRLQQQSEVNVTA